jgi:hypothetical protein
LARAILDDDAIDGRDLPELDSRKAHAA